jgi:hypothetical protein
LEEIQADDKDHPAFKLIGHWRETLWKGGDDVKSKKVPKAASYFETTRSMTASPVLADVKPVDEAYFMKVWKWIDANL